MRSTAADSRALFECTSGGSGFIGLSFSLASRGLLTTGASALSVTWPLADFLQSLPVAVSLTQSIALTPFGAAVGGLVVQGDLYSLMESDLFGSAPAGLLVPTPNDPIDVDTVLSIFSAILSTLQTNQPELDSTLVSLFPDTNNAVNDLLMTYASRTDPSRQSLVGFLQWRSLVAHLPVSLSADGLELNISVTVAVEQVPSVSVSNETATCINNQLSKLGGVTKSEYSQVANFTVGLLQIGTITSVTMTGFVAGVITIDLHSSIPNASLAYARTFAAMTTINATWPAGENFLLGRVEATWDGLESTCTLIAQASADAAIVLPFSRAVLALDASGQATVGDFQLSDANLADIADDLVMLSNEIDSLFPDTLGEGISANLGCISFDAPQCVTLGLLALSTSFRARVGSTLTAFAACAEIKHSLQDWLLQGAAFGAVTVDALPGNAAAGNLDVRLRAYFQQPVGVPRTNSRWEYVAGTDRWEIPLFLQTTFVFSLGSLVTSEPLSDFTVQGSGALAGFNVPYFYQMLAGIATGFVNLDVDYSYLNTDLVSPMNAILSISLEEGLAMQSTFSDPDITNATSTTDIAFFTDLAVDASTVERAHVGNALQDGLFGLLDTMLDGPLGIVIPPLAQSLGKDVSFLQPLQQSVIPWLSLPHTFVPSVANVQNVNSDSQSTDLAWNVSLNGYQHFACILPATTSHDFKSWGELVNAKLNLCGAATYLTALTAPSSEVAFPGAWNLALVASTPGLLVSANLTTFSNANEGPSGMFSPSVTWTPQPVPHFASWSDFSWLLFSSLPYLSVHVAPNRTRVAVANIPDLIPIELQAVYPPTLPAVFVDIDLRANNSHAQVALATRLATSSVLQTHIYFDNASGVGHTSSRLSAGYGVVYGAPPAPGTIAISTNFNEKVRADNATIPPAPNNTLTVSISAELRSTSNVMQATAINCVDTVTFLPGKLVAESFLEDVVPQILSDPLCKPLLNISFVPPARFLSPFPQVHFTLRAYPLDGGDSWIVPLALSIDLPEGSAIPGIFNGGINNSPARAVSISRNLELTNDFRMDAELPHASGSVSILNVSSDAIHAAVEFSTIISHRQVLQRISRAVAAATHRVTFFGDFSVAWDVDSKVNLNEVELDVANTGPPLAPIEFALTRTVLTTTEMELTAAVQQLFLFDLLLESNKLNEDLDVLNSSDPDAMTSGRQMSASNTFSNNDALWLTLNTSASPLCTWLTHVVEMQDDLLASPLLQATLPFVESSLAFVLADSLAAGFSDLKVEVCNSRRPVTLAMLCVELSELFGGDAAACTGVLTSTQLQIDLSVYLELNYRDSLVLNLNTFYPSAAQVLLPTVVATSDLLFEARPSCNFRFIADLSQLTLTLDTSGSTFVNLLVGFSARSNVNAVVGPLRLPLAMSRLELNGGNPSLPLAQLNASLGPQFTPTLALQGAAAFSAFIPVSTNAQSCSLTVDIPALSGFLTDPSSPGAFNVVEWFCGDGFIAELLETVSQQSLLTYFSLDLFNSQWDVSMGEFVESLVGVDGPLWAVAAPLIGSVVNNLLEQALAGIFGPERSVRFVALLHDMLNSILLEDPWAGNFTSASTYTHVATNRFANTYLPDPRNHYSLNTKDLYVSPAVKTTRRRVDKSADSSFASLENRVLAGFTAVLCTVLGDSLTSCPTAPVFDPNSTSREYQWALDFSKGLDYALTQVEFELGAQAAALLYFDCGANLHMSFQFTPVLHFSEVRGVYLTFNDPLSKNTLNPDVKDPVFGANIFFDLLEPCKLGGYLGFLGAEVSPLHSDQRMFSGVLNVFNDSVDFRVDADLSGELQIGFAGPLAEALSADPANAMEALPHWQAQVALTWTFDIHGEVTPVPRFALTQVEMCLGRILGEMMNAVFGEVMKILDPLDPVIGPNGVLQFPIPGLSWIFGRDISLVELLMVFCGPDCSWNGVLEALQTVLDLYAAAEKAFEISQVDSNGCGIIQAVQSFAVDFRAAFDRPSSDLPTVEFFGEIPSMDLQFPDTSISEEARSSVSAYWSGIQQQGTWGIICYFCNDPANTIVGLILGQDLPLVGMSVPRFSFSGIKTWTITVWAPIPIINILLSLGCGVTADVGEIALMSKVRP
jgi:hypothetical protein